VGILSRLDVLRAVTPAHLAEESGGEGAAFGQTVGEVMDRVVPTVSFGAELVDVAEQMARTRLKRVIVVDDSGRVAGIISDRDIVERVAPEARRGLLAVLTRREKAAPVSEATAEQVMTPNVLTGPATTSIADAIHQMVAEGRKRFVVVDDLGRPVGIVDRQRLLRAVGGGLEPRAN
jgi:CBS domain-containing protein